MAPRLGWIRSALAAALLSVAASQARAADPARIVLLATTTSTQDSGLLDVLVPAFEKQTGYVVKTISVGSGQAIALGRKGEADVLLVHSPEDEQKLVADGFGVNRRAVMHNDFVVVGPPSDPAKVRGAPSVAEGLRRIAAAGATFLSRGDSSGTHAREKGLWKATGFDPEGKPWYQQTGLGMGDTLNVAAEKAGYTLTDRGTFLARRRARPLALAVVVEKEPLLLNVYHVIEVSPARWPKVNAAGAKAFADFLVAPATQIRHRELRGRPARRAALRPGRGEAPRGRALMDVVLDGLWRALSLLVHLDPEVLGITALSLEISATATLLSLLVGISAGVAVALSRFPGKRLVVSLVNTGMGLPPVVVGLFVSILLWRSGPLGGLGLLYTPTAIVIAQAVIATPIVMGITVSAVQSLPPALHLQILALGATRAQHLWLLVREARLPLMAAVMAGFGGVISEVGASIMVGGNIKGSTRVLTTATVMEVGRGNFDVAIALSFILLAASLGVNYLLTIIQQRERPR